MSELSRGSGVDQSSSSQRNQRYILKDFNRRKKVAEGVVFGDAVSKSEKQPSLHSNQSHGTSQLIQHNSSSSMMNKNESKNNGNRFEESEDERQENQREAEKRLIEEEIQKKNMLQNKKQQSKRQEQEQQSNGFADLDFYHKPHKQQNNVAEEEKLNLMSPQQQKQIEQAYDQEQQKRQPQKQIQFLKQKLQRLSIFNEGHIHPIIKAVSENNKIIQMTQKRLQDQNTILSQFKQQASKKLQENIKNTLKQKMNEMNRDNAKQLKDIKNMSLFIQQLLEKYDTKMDKIEKNLDELIKTNQKK